MHWHTSTNAKHARPDVTHCSFIIQRRNWNCFNSIFIMAVPPQQKSLNSSNLCNKAKQLAMKAWSLQITTSRSSTELFLKEGKANWHHEMRHTKYQLLSQAMSTPSNVTATSNHNCRNRLYSFNQKHNKICSARVQPAAIYDYSAIGKEKKVGDAILRTPYLASR